MLRINPDWVMLVPLCLAPILVRVFFDLRVALYIHLVIIIIIASIAAIVLIIIVVYLLSTYCRNDVYYQREEFRTSFKFLRGKFDGVFDLFRHIRFRGFKSGNHFRKYSYR